MASPAEVAELFHLMRKEEFDRAIKLAPRLVAAHPGDNDLVACHAFLLANAGRFEECAKLCERATKEVRPSVEFYKTYSQYRLGQLDAAAEVGERSSDERLQVLVAQTKFRRAALLASRRSPFTPSSQEGEAVATARATALEAAEGYASIARAATGALDEAQVAGNMVAALAMTGAGGIPTAPAGATELAASVGPDMEAHAEALFNAASASSAGVGVSLLGSAAAFVSAADRITRTEMEEGAPEEEAEEIVAQLRAQAAVAAGALGYGPGADAALAAAAAASARGGDRVTAALARACRLAAQARQEGGARGPELFAGLRSIKAALSHAPSDGDKDDTAVPKVTAAQAAALRAARTAALAALSRPADATTAAAAAEAVAPGAAMSPAVAAAMAAREAATAAAAAAGPASKRDHRDGQRSSVSGLSGFLADADPEVVLGAAEPILVEALAAASKHDWEVALSAALSGASGRGAVSGIAGPATGAGLDLGPIALALTLAQLQLAAGRYSDASTTLAMSGAAAGSLPAVLAARLRAARLSGDATCVTDAEEAAVKAMAAAEAAAKSAGEGAAVENAASTLAALSAVLVAHFTDSDAKRAVELALSGASSSSSLAEAALRGAGPKASKAAVSALLRGAGRSLSCVAADALTSGTADAAGADALFGRVISAAGASSGAADVDVDALDAAGIPDDADDAPGAAGDVSKPHHPTAAATGAGGPSPAGTSAATAAGAGAAAAASSAGASGAAAAASAAATAEGDLDSDSQDDADAGAGAGAGAEAGGGTRKSREAVLRRRRRKRDEHIAALKAEAAKTGTALPRVDPDRWLPKALRGKRGRKRRKGMNVEHGGTQGAGSFDASLDARAKAAARSAAPEPVESEAKKGARGSRLPKQRMRKPRR